ncbi:hypothetical protein LSH36_625g01002 [Paralvinella palmiformis]|uniref:Snurportin-1 n=1 Tax=Paralvinella palmiformis TaxID=53620 RepID=A0AAD9J4E7_9ANNE|nr:hypothetical protein LSH36_625g01002 [Paralvinella palmiformis]
MEVPVEQRLSSRDGSIGFNFGDAIQKLGSFDFGTSSASVQLPPNLVGTSVEGQSNNVNTLMLDDSIVTEEAPSRFAYLYKTKGIKDAQRQRMEESLHRQKQRRYDYQNHVRRLTDLVTKDEQLDDRHATADSQQMDWKRERKSKSEQHRKSLIKFQNQKMLILLCGHFQTKLMFSEWLLEKPERFEEDWVMVAVPKGRRNLIIATHGSTVSYSKNGMFINQFSSHLPGGGRHKHKWNNACQYLIFLAG